MSITIDVAFRYDKKFDTMQMFYYDEHLNLVCFSLEEGHGEACYEYYLSCKPIDTKSEEQMDMYRAIAKYYVDDKTKLRVKKKLAQKCSY